MSKAYLKKKISEGLADKSSRLGRFRALGIIKPGIVQMVKRSPDLRNQLRNIKEYAIHNLPALLEQAVTSLKDNGCQVFIAPNTHEAVQYIKKIVNKGLVVKSKSNAGKEINITKRLEEQGARVIETDLGDRINQLAGSSASHPLAPAIHIPIEKVAELFSKEAGEPLECNTEALVKAARKSLRCYLEEADVGITGANAVVAETGSIILAENEGNIRAVTSLPKVHIAIAGIEKIVPSLSDGITVVKAAAAYGVGQDIGTYVTVISGPARYRGESLSFFSPGQGPEEVHVVFLTGGREKAINEGFAEALYCINCGSCLNFCPVYTEIGEKYGDKYLGGHGTVFTAFHDSLGKAQEAGLSLCIGCRKCLESCAVGINTPEMVLRLRARADAENKRGWTRKKMLSVLVENKLPRYIKLARTFQDIVIKRQVSNRFAALPMGLPGLGIPADRLIPVIAEKSLGEMIRGRPLVKSPKMRVAFFAGCLVKYFLPHLGIDLLDVLEAQGIEVVVNGDEACCGLPMLNSGATEEVKVLARHNVRLFAQEEVEYLVFVCPTCAATVKKEWPKLLENEDDELKQQSRELAARVMDISQFLLEVMNIEESLQTKKIKVTYHDSCHLARRLEVRKEPRSILESIQGVELVEMAEADSCCGFGGSFSLLYYDLASQIGAKKAEKIKATGTDCVVTGCPGCMIHLTDSLNHAGSSQKVVHTIELVAEALRGGGTSGTGACRNSGKGYQDSAGANNPS